MPILAAFALFGVVGYLLKEWRNYATSFTPPHDEAHRLTTWSPPAPRHGNSRTLGQLPWALPAVSVPPSPRRYPRAARPHPVFTLGMLDDDLPAPTAIPGPGTRMSR